MVLSSLTNEIDPYRNSFSSVGWAEQWNSHSEAQQRKRMATEVGSTLPDDMAGGAQPKAAILLIAGEPFSEDDKTLILAEITKGQ